MINYAAILAVTSPVLLFFVFLGLFLSGTFSSSSPPRNPLCTPAAVASFNAAWTAQVSAASLASVQSVLNEATAATEQRIILCGGG